MEHGMTKIINFIKRYSVLTYFMLTLIISWSGILILLGPGGFTGATKPTDTQLPLIFVAMFAGPSVAGILLTGFIHGREGLRGLFSRLLRWRVGARWIVVACLTAPILMLTILLALSLISPGFIPAVFSRMIKRLC
jgi:hypothetical protein